MPVKMSKHPHETNSIGVQYKIFVRTNGIINKIRLTPMRLSGKPFLDGDNSGGNISSLRD